MELVERFQWAMSNAVSGAFLVCYSSEEKLFLGMHDMNLSLLVIDN